ncbi:hypothetical protein KQH56_02610 [bacterium]|nr:hypothetical protein [bacterium]
MKASWVLVVLAILTALLGGAAAGLGLFEKKSGESFEFTTVRGSTVELYGRGLYKYDTTFMAAGFKGQNAVALLLGVPLMVIAILLYLRGSVVGHLMLVGMFGYFLYLYSSMALGAAYNPLFLLYIVIFAASLFGFILSFNAAVVRLGVFDSLATLPGKGLAVFMLIAGAGTLFVWGSPLITSLMEGVAPDRMDSYSTMVTFALDLATITPATIVCGLLVLRGDAAGYVLATPLLTLLILLMPQIVLSTIYQVRAGVDLTVPEMVGPVAGFVVMGGVALFFLIRLLQRVARLA